MSKFLNDSRITSSYDKFSKETIIKYSTSVSAFGKIDLKKTIFESGKNELTIEFIAKLYSIGLTDHKSSIPIKYEILLDDDELITINLRTAQAFTKRTASVALDETKSEYHVIGALNESDLRKICKAKKLDIRSFSSFPEPNIISNSDSRRFHNTIKFFFYGVVDYDEKMAKEVSDLLNSKRIAIKKTLRFIGPYIILPAVVIIIIGFISLKIYFDYQHSQSKEIITNVWEGYIECREPEYSASYVFEFYKQGDNVLGNVKFTDQKGRSGEFIIQAGFDLKNYFLSRGEWIIKPEGYYSTPSFSGTVKSKQDNSIEIFRSSCSKERTLLKLKQP